MAKKDQVLLSAFIDEEHAFLHLLTDFLLASNLCRLYQRIVVVELLQALAPCSTRCLSKVALWTKITSGMASHILRKRASAKKEWCKCRTSFKGIFVVGGFFFFFLVGLSKFVFRFFQYQQGK